jgi:hypothetical protein
MDRSHLSILPPTSLLVEPEIEGESRPDPVLDSLLHLRREAILHRETNFPAPVRPHHSDVLDGRFLGKSWKGKGVDQKEDEPYDYPSIFDTSSHKGYSKTMNPQSQPKKFEISGFKFEILTDKG